MPHKIQKDAEFTLIWGAEQIAEELGLKTSQVFYMLESGKLPARKVGGRWVVERGKLRAFFGFEPANPVEPSKNDPVIKPQRNTDKSSYFADVDEAAL